MSRLVAATSKGNAYCVSLRNDICVWKALVIAVDFKGGIIALNHDAPTSKARFRWRLSPFDVVCAIIAPVVALLLRDPSLVYLELTHSYEFVLATVICALPIFVAFRLSDGMSRFFSAHDLWAVVGATLVTTAASSFALFTIDRLEGVPRSTPLIYGLVLGSGLLVGRGFARFFNVGGSSGVEAERAPHLRRVILVGVDRFAAMAIKLTASQEPRTTVIVATLDDRERLTGRTVNGVRIVGKVEDLDAVIEEYAVHGVEVDEIWFTEKGVSIVEADRLRAHCRARGIRFISLSSALNLTPVREPSFADPGEVRVRRQPSTAYFRIKRVVDIAAAAFLLSALAPLALMIAIVTQADVGAPVIFWQQRIGRRGKRFILYKFRTYQAPFAKNGAPVDSGIRLSRMGRWIRAIRLDEIPQLVNIVRGDMSLIGPRPLLPKDQPKDPRTRLLVRPGVTGWAQVNGGNFVTAEEKDALDIWYIHHASFFLDLRIVWRTLMTVVRGEKRYPAAIEAANRWCELTQRSKSNDRWLSEAPQDLGYASARSGLHTGRAAPIA